MTVITLKADKSALKSWRTTKIHVKIRASRTKSHFYILFTLWLAWCTQVVVRDSNLLLPFGGSYLFAAVLSLLLSANHVQTMVGLTMLVITCLFQPTPVKAVSVAAGYLTFDHWFSAIGGIDRLKSTGQIFEDCVTLTAFLGIYLEWTNTNEPLTHNDYLMAIRMWAVFKMVRMCLSLKRRRAARPVKKKPTTQTVPTIKKQVWRINNINYDLSPFVDSHPGGKEAILLGRGRSDCTALFQSYHPFVKRPQQVLQKYRIAGQDDQAIATEDPFYAILVKAVEKTLYEHNFDPVRDRAATPRRVAYYLLILTAVICGCIAHCRGSMLGSLLLAFPGWLIGALGHDGGHFAVSRQWPVLNDWAVWGMSFLSNPIIWQHQHTFAHHSHTNLLDHDPDLHHFVDILRLHRGVPQQLVFRNQASKLYVLFAYTLVIIGTCFFLPWQLVQDGSLYSMVEWTDRQRPWRTAGMYVHLLCYTGFIAILPFFVHQTWQTAFMSAVLHMAASGVLFAVFSQIGHLNEASMDSETFQQRNANRDTVLTNSWAVQQIETSNNFCPDSAMWHVLSNGLNLQIEHHLFPGINHCHLHLIQPTVEAVCKEHGVCYKSYGSWNEVMGATLDWLDKLSQPELAKSK